MPKIKLGNGSKASKFTGSDLPVQSIFKVDIEPFTECIYLYIPTLGNYILGLEVESGILTKFELENSFTVVGTYVYNAEVV